MSISLVSGGRFCSLSKDISCEEVLRFGNSAASVLCRKNGGRLLVGMDTRRSSSAYEAALTAGILSWGADVVSLGVIPEPGGAFLVKKLDADGLIMIGDPDHEASFSGITVLDRLGRRISEDMAEKISDDLNEKSLKSSEGFGRRTVLENAVKDYAEYVHRFCDTDLSGMTVAADCANGAVSAAAEEIFSSLGAKVYLLNCDPNGDNINSSCGLSHPEGISAFVREKKCDLGIMFDGFGSKCLAVDEKGIAADGEKLLAVFAKDMAARNKLYNNSVVISASANLGFSVFAEKNNIKPVATKSGGRHILEKMLAGGYSLGGELSGRIIFGDISSEADGIITAVRLLSAVRRSGKSLGELCSVMERYPQVAIKVKISEGWREAWKNIPELEEFIESKEMELGGSGRIVVRESPSEPVIKVTVEGMRFDAVNTMAVQIAEMIRKHCPVI